jgi:hypothetical protein
LVSLFRPFLEAYDMIKAAISFCFDISACAASGPKSRKVCLFVSAIVHCVQDLIVIELAFEDL